MNYYTIIKDWFISQPQQKKWVMASALTLFILTTTTLSLWVFSTDYGVLFNHLDTRDANQIINQLEQDDIPYRLDNEGQDILIDKNKIEKTRIKLMGSGMQLTGNVGFELFDKSDFGMTDFSQKINYQRALQGELERTINSLDEVRLARIHLVIPESHLFQQEDNLPRAAVTLHLRRPLSQQQVQSIQQLITASVARMPEKNVIIVDQNGNRLTMQTKAENANHFTHKKRVESYLTAKVMQMLKPVFADQVMVKIDATLNYDRLEREVVKPQQQGLVTHEKETRHSSGNNKNKETNNQDLTLEKTYQFGNEKERFIRADGNLERLTISVILPKDTDLATMNQVDHLVKSVVGFDGRRGDTISLEALIQPRQTPKLKTRLSFSQPQPVNFHPMIASGIILLLLMSGFQHLRLRKKKRQLLLIELTSWLNHHG